MRVYQIHELNSDKPSLYRGTKSEAHEAAKLADKVAWSDIKITEIDVQSDKEGVVAALNGDMIFTEVQSWGLTKRGGLEEWKE